MRLAHARRGNDGYLGERLSGASKSADLYNYQPLNLLITPQERGSLFTQLNYDLNDYVSMYGEVLYTHTTSGFQIAALPFDAVQDDTIISANSIYNPFGIDFGGVSGENPNMLMRMEALGTRRSEVSTDDTLVNAGFRGKVLDTGWEWDANFAFGRKEQEQNISGYLLTSQLQNALGPSFIGANGPQCGTPASRHQRLYSVQHLQSDGPEPGRGAQHDLDELSHQLHVPKQRLRAECQRLALRAAGRRQCSLRWAPNTATRKGISTRTS